MCRVLKWPSLRYIFSLFLSICSPNVVCVTQLPSPKPVIVSQLVVHMTNTTWRFDVCVCTVLIVSSLEYLSHRKPTITCLKNLFLEIASEAKVPDTSAALWDAVNVRLSRHDIDHAGYTFLCGHLDICCSHTHFC